MHSGSTLPQITDRIELKKNLNGLSKNNLMQLALCPAALLPELKPAPCFLSAIIGQID